MSALFHIVIVVYRNGQEVQDTIRALATQTYSDFHVTILDNDCPLNCSDNLALPDSRFKIIHSEKNLGFAGGCNLASRNGVTPWLIMLNPDAQPLPNWLEEIKCGIETYDAKMFGSTQVLGHNRDLADGFGDVLSIFGFCWRGGYGHTLKALPDKDQRILSPCAAASVYRRDYFEKLGGFDEVFFCYLEDVDLGLRMQGIGSNCIQLREAQVIHIGGSSLETGSDFGLMQSTKNSVRLIIKNMPGVMAPIMLTLYVASQFWFRVRSKDPNKAQKRLRALSEGLKRWKADYKARRGSSQISYGLLFEFLDWRLTSLKRLPIKSQPILKKKSDSS